MVRGRVPAMLLGALLATACTSGSPDPGGTDPAAAGSDPTAAGPSLPPAPALSPAERLVLRPGWGPSYDELDRAARIVRRMRLADLAGQVIVAEWSGTRAPVSLVERLHLGGVIAFAGNITSTRQIRAVNAALRRSAGRGHPLFLAVDQEGGLVERVKDDATRFPAFMSAGAARDTELTRGAARASGAELRGLGFTVNFAPVADVTSGPEDPTIGSRSAGSDPRLVAEQAGAAAAGYLAAGVLPVVKHFPGHGSVRADSHVRLPVQARSLRQLRRVDLLPFRAAVEAGLPAVMVGHIDVRAVDPGVPSSLSGKVVTGLLRRRLGFDGLVVTDSLSMAALPAGDSGALAVRALRAGNDVLLMPRDPAAARAGLVRAVRAGRLPRDRVEQAAARQIALLLDRRDGAGSPPGSGRAASRALSAAAITVVAGRCRGRLVGRAVRPVGDPVAVARFSAAAAAAGLPVRRRGDAVTRVAFSGYADRPPRGDVLVAVDRPYVLRVSRAPVRIATYGDTPGAMASLVEVLLGRAGAPGRLPVTSGFPRRGC